MRADIHPKYQNIQIKCSCGHKFTVGSTLAQDLSIEVCSKCHPFYTGQHKIVDTAGRVDKFNKKFQGVASFSVKAKAKQDQPSKEDEK